MKGDFSRFTFNPGRHYSSVRVQQGRVQLDADWNEQVDIQAHLSRTAGADVIGASGAPRLAAGFAITALGDNLAISVGRYYVDGILVENESEVLFKPAGSQPAQPHGAIPADWRPDVAGAYVVFLDVWERHVTAVDVPALREVALGGPDTATRTQVIWQVRLLPSDALAELPSAWDVPEEWTLFAGQPRGGMAARTQPIITTAGPCVVPASAGYRRLENQLYRVEIHDIGGVGKATFKWSRDNGIVATRLLGAPQQRVLTVADPGRDESLGFGSGQWIEVIDDGRLLRREPGVMVRIKGVVEDTIEIEAWPGADPNTPPVFDLTTTVVRRWDQSGIDAVLAVPAVDGEPTWVDLEDGLQVSFDGSATYEAGDYWLIPARTISANGEGGGIDWPGDPAAPPYLPPQGIQHHFARLAVVSWDGAAYTVNHDSRWLFPSLTEPELRYLSGDGQEAMPGDTLPQPLRVSVSNCNRPLQGAWIRFEISAEGAGGDGELLPQDGAVIASRSPASGAIKSFVVAADADGEASCRWRLQSRASLEPAVSGEAPELPAQSVRATLLESPDDSEDRRLDGPIVFGASFGVAWEIQYGGSDFPDTGHAALQVQTVEDALDQLRENTALQYVGGDGQQILVDAELPEPLVVRVANGQWPRTGATVRFEIDAGAGQLFRFDDHAGSGSLLDATTDQAGLARCYWRPDWTSPAPVQRVVASLRDPVQPIQDGFNGELWFSAQRSNAADVAYAGAFFPDSPPLKISADNVEAALDQLRQNVALYLVGGDGQVSMPGDGLPQFLQVRVANGGWPVAGATVRFHTADGGLLSDGQQEPGPMLDTRTDEGGLAQVRWTLDPTGANSQTATAELIAEDGPFRLPGPELPRTVRFAAQLSTADQVAVVANSESDTENPATTVQRALDELYLTKLDRAGDVIKGDLEVDGDLAVGGKLKGTAIVGTDQITDGCVTIQKLDPDIPLVGADLNRVFKVPRLRQSLFSRPRAIVSNPNVSQPIGAVFDGVNLWVVNSSWGGAAKFDVQSNEMTAFVRLDDPQLWGFPTFDGEYLWICGGQNTNQLFKIHIDKNQVVATVSGIGALNAAAFDGTHLWIAGDDVLTQIDPVNNKVVGVIQVSGTKSWSGLEFDGTSLWLSSKGLGQQLVKVDVKTATVSAQIYTSDTLAGDLTFDGRYLWAGSASWPRMLKIDVEQNLVVATVDLPLTWPYLAFDGTNLWVAFPFHDFVMIVDVNTHAVLANIPSVPGISSWAFDGESMWAPCYSTGQILKFRKCI